MSQCRESRRDSFRVEVENESPSALALKSPTAGPLSGDALLLLASSANPEGCE